LPVSVDIDSSLYFARAVAEKTGAILAPGITYGFADEMREYHGSLGVTTETFSAMMTDLCRRFCAQAFKKVIFITGHGTNKIPCELAFYKVWDTYLISKVFAGIGGPMVTLQKYIMRTKEKLKWLWRSGPLYSWIG
jgi:creatinine amidohydrolase